jgi:hypothetical protein
MIEAILPRVGGAPGGGREGEASMIVGGGQDCWWSGRDRDSGCSGRAVREWGDCWFGLLITPVR